MKNPSLPARRRTAWAAALLVSLGTLTACTEAPKPPVAETVRPAYVTPVRGGAAASLEFVGEVRAARRAELAFAASGRVAAVMVDVGDTVQAGQVLARLDEQPLRAQLAAAQADVARAQVAAAEVRSRNERVAVAQRAGATSAGEAEALRAELGAAEAALQAAQAQRELAAWTLAQAVLRAPQAGVVAQRLLEPGQATGPGAPVITLDGAGRELVVMVPGSLALKPGQAAVLRQGTQELPSRVLRSAARLEAGGVRRVMLSVPETAAVGATWTIALMLPASGTAPLQVPLRAVLPGPDASQGEVLRLAADGRTTEKAVVRLGELHGEWVDVRSGLVAKDRVVVGGAAGIRPGTVVQPVAYPAGGQ